MSLRKGYLYASPVDGISNTLWVSKITHARLALLESTLALRIHPEFNSWAYGYLFYTHSSLPALPAPTCNLLVHCPGRNKPLTIPLTSIRRFYLKKYRHPVPVPPKLFQNIRSYTIRRPRSVGTRNIIQHQICGTKLEFPNRAHDGMGRPVVGKGVSHLSKESLSAGGAEACCAVILKGDGDAVLCNGELGSRR